MRANGAAAKKPARGGLGCESNQAIALMQQALEAIYLIALCGKPCGAAALLQALHAGCGHVQQFGFHFASAPVNRAANPVSFDRREFSRWRNRVKARAFSPPGQRWCAAHFLV